MAVNDETSICQIRPLLKIGWCHNIGILSFWNICELNSEQINDCINFAGLVQYFCSNKFLSVRVYENSFIACTEGAIALRAYDVKMMSY